MSNGGAVRVLGLMRAVWVNHWMMKIITGDGGKVGTTFSQTTTVRKEERK